MAMKKHGLFKKIMSSFLSAACALSMTAVGTTLASTTANAARSVHILMGQRYGLLPAD